ncbi:helix-turn-helix domain-containing protein [Lactococcus lactis]|uniref:helix-turn-helix domain-containing protein n=1 Tax=Lactococcus lactis TaxID=1358 RepID=UPI00177B33D1|nr:helix-turn-helix transcriptional regulator [Lactococcus lactis]
MAKNRIKELRNSANPKITLKELSEKLKEKGLSFTDSQLSKFENGTSTPRNDDIWEALAQIFNTDKLYVMGFLDIKSPSNPKLQLAEIDREIQEIEEILKNKPKEYDKEILEENKKELLSFRNTVIRAEKNIDKLMALKIKSDKLENDKFKLNNESVEFILMHLKPENCDTWIKMGYALLDSQKLKETRDDRAET